MTFRLDDAFRRRTINSIFSILTETGSVRESEESTDTYGGFHASHEQVYRRFKLKVEDAIIKRSPVFNQYRKGDEFKYYWETLKDLLMTPPAEKDPFVVIQSRRTQEKKPKQVLQEWYSDNEELVEQTRIAINDIVVSAIAAAWGMREEPFLERFLANDDIYAVHQSDTDLFDSILGTREIHNVFNGVLRLKNGGDALENAVLKALYLGNEENMSIQRRKILEGSVEYRGRVGSNGQTQQRQRGAMHASDEKENVETQAIQDAVDSIQTSACIETICNILRRNAEKEQVCQVVLERLVELLEKGLIKVRDMLEEGDNVLERIVVGMTSFGTNEAIQQCGVTLLWRSKSWLPANMSSIQGPAATAVCTAITNVPDDSDVQRRGLGLLNKLGDAAAADGTLVQFHSNLVDSRALHYVTAALVTHKENYSIVKYALTFLVNVLGDTDDERVLEFVEDQQAEIKSIVKAAYRYQRDDVNEARARNHLKPLVQQVRDLTCQAVATAGAVPRGERLQRLVDFNE